MPLLECNGLVKDYPGKRAVDGVNFHVERGEIVGLLGPNGAGKTTSFRMACGLIAPTEGRVTLNGTDVTSWPMYRRARHGMGFLPQDESIFGKLSVEQNMFAILEYLPISRRERIDECDRLLGEFGLTEKRKQQSSTLSGGERRRLEIARALVTRPQFLLLDEPFAGVDPIAVNDIRLLVRYLTQRNIGVLITDHNVRETLSLIDRAYIIHSGRVLMHGTPEEIVENPDVRRLYLGEQFRL